VIMEQTSLNYRTAHRIVGLAIRLAIDKGEKEGLIPTDSLDEAARQVLGHSLALPNEVLSSLIAPSAIVATRQGIGGAAREPVLAMLRECQAFMMTAQQWMVTMTQHLDNKEKFLVEQATALAATA